jgi:hypothetical protein
MYNIIYWILDSHHYELIWLKKQSLIGNKKTSAHGFSPLWILLIDWLKKNKHSSLELIGKKNNCSRLVKTNPNQSLDDSINNRSFALDICLNHDGVGFICAGYLTQPWWYRMDTILNNWQQLFVLRICLSHDSVKWTPNWDLEAWSLKVVYLLICWPPISIK